MANREDIAQKLVALKAEAEKMAKSYNEKSQSGKMDEAAKLEEKITQKVNEYTSMVREECFKECRATENPMLHAVELLTYVTIAVKDEKPKDSKFSVRSIVEKNRQIDLLKLHQGTSDGIGADKNWAFMIQKLNLLLTIRACQRLNIDPKSVNDSYSMAEVAREIDLGKTPTSNTNMLKTVQKIVDAMLGDGYKATSHDVNYLLDIYVRKSRKALTVVCSNHRILRENIAGICHRIVTEGVYGAEFPKKKLEALGQTVQTSQKSQKAAKTTKAA